MSHRRRETCARCGRVVAARDGFRAVGVVPHKCPHGRQCVWPRRTPREPDVNYDCVECLDAIAKGATAPGGA